MWRSNSATLKYDKWIKTLTCVFRLHNLPTFGQSTFQKKMQRDCCVPNPVRKVSTSPPSFPSSLPHAGLDLPAGVKCWRTAPPNPPSSSPRVCHIHPSCWDLRENSFWLPQWTQQLTRSVWNIDYSWMEGQLMDDGWIKICFWKPVPDPIL